MFQDIFAAIVPERDGQHRAVDTYLDADDETLRRFKETRRRHPLSPDGNIISGISRER